MQILENVNLKALNTFHLEVTATKMAIVQNEEELKNLLSTLASTQEPLSILGGGSNILFTQNLQSLLIKNELKGIEIIYEDDTQVHVTFQSGENWHQCVLWAVQQNLGGIENLSLIPGTIGASPIQNIGAYGIELKDVFVSCEAINLKTLERTFFNNKSCEFGYRDSIFKRQAKGQYFITSVTLALQKRPIFRTDYGDIQKVLHDHFEGKLSVKTISDAVVMIRSSKLPNPDEIGNAGSFFKNPVIDLTQFSLLQKNFPSIPSFAAPNGVKIPAAWLIEQCGWKGIREGHIGVHDRQALVLIHHGKGQGKDILDLSERIITSVQQRFNILLDREVNVW